MVTALCRYLFESYGIGNPKMIEIMTKEAPRFINEIDIWGGDLKKLDNGKLDQRFLVPIHLEELVIQETSEDNQFLIPL